MKNHVGHELSTSLNPLLILILSRLHDLGAATGELQEHAEELDALIFALAVINSNELLAILFKVALFFEELDHDFWRRHRGNDNDQWRIWIRGSLDGELEYCALFFKIKTISAAMMSW